MRGVKMIKEKELALQLRHEGKTYPEIEIALGVNRSTLSTWLRGLHLSPEARIHIDNKKKLNLKEARLRASNFHKTARLARVKKSDLSVKAMLNSFQISKEILELILSGLYMGEGFKNRACIALGNSNPEIIKLFLNLLRLAYPIDENKFRCFLYLRHDQSETAEIDFWSKVTNIPKGKFNKTQFDKRTIGKKTWKSYHGVCAVWYYDANLEKRLTSLQNGIFERVSAMRL